MGKVKKRCWFIEDKNKQVPLLNVKCENFKLSWELEMWLKSQQKVEVLIFDDDDMCELECDFMKLRLK